MSSGMPHAAIAIDQGRNRRLAQDRRDRRHIDPTALPAGVILGQHRNPVAGDAAKIGPDQGFGHPFRLVGGHAPGAQDQEDLIPAGGFAVHSSG